jgi:hypothetical protein
MMELAWKAPLSDRWARVPLSMFSIMMIIDSLDINRQLITEDMWKVVELNG